MTEPVPAVSFTAASSGWRLVLLVWDLDGGAKTAEHAEVHPVVGWTSDTSWWQHSESGEWFPNTRVEPRIAATQLVRRGDSLTQSATDALADRADLVALLAPGQPLTAATAGEAPEVAHFGPTLSEDYQGGAR